MGNVIDATRSDTRHGNVQRKETEQTLKPGRGTRRTRGKGWQRELGEKQMRAIVTSKEVKVS